MEDLVVRQNNLPMMADGEVKKFVDDIGFAIDAIRAKRTAAGRYGVDKSVLDEMDNQIIQLSAIKLEALMELGDRTSAMDTGKTGPKSFFQSVEETPIAITKADQLSELGISAQRANEAEQMARNRPVVEQYIEESIAKGKAPSKNGVLQEIKRQESYIKEEVDTSKKNNTRSEQGEKVVQGRELSKRIAEIDRLMSDPDERHEYTIEDAEEEFEIIMNEFMSKIRRVIEVRSNVVKGSKKLKSLIFMFSTELKKLKEEI